MASPSHPTKPARMKQNCFLFYLSCLAAGLFVVALFRHLGQDTAFLLQSKPVTYLNGSFEQVALKYGTDKVTTHNYQLMYEKYMSPFRNLPIKMLEIGLGCNMVLITDYGPGASYHTWLEYLSHVNLYFIEYDARCANKYRDKAVNAQVYVGDQADVAFLEQVVADTTTEGLFDIIIDDGGHTMEQQTTSLEHLWPVVKPGGLYVIEDLQTSYWPDYGGDPSTRNPAKHTTMKYLYELLDDMMIKRDSKPVSHDLLSVECMAEICALRKRYES
ncbi:hypothetical protein CDD83_7228 [Cordyceps sp. RAO-2017]|nr:hypothetical protein CDD83_7228 [Cordyceps sp. RAO-2017]